MDARRLESAMKGKRNRGAKGERSEEQVRTRSRDRA